MSACNWGVAAEMRIISFLLLVVAGKCENIVQPNIVFIVADDLGWDDVSFHGSRQIMTPNIDALAYQGIILSQYYTDCRGTASRSALFTGKYPMRMGTQGISIAAGEDRGVPPSERLLPSYLQELGYVTHLIGKWELGKSREHYLPTNRGFDTFYGFLGSDVDYYTYNHVQNLNGTVLYGLDLFHNFTPIEDQSGHLTNILTNQAIKVIRNHNTSVPLYVHISHAAAHVGGGCVNLQAPEESIAANDHIAHSARRLYAGLVTGLDASVGNIIAALAERNILHNTIIVFASDNGAPSTGFNRNFGSNLPLRGTKGSPWEGALRSTAVIWQASLPSKIWSGLFHVIDWLPTLIGAAGGNISEKIDGINQWSAVMSSKKSPRSEILLGLDDLANWAALRVGNYKIIIGDVDKGKSGYYSKELKLFRLPVFPYVNVLLSSETARVFKETLYVNVDVDMALKKQNYTNLRSYSKDVDEKELCVPTSSKGCLFDLTEDPLETNDLWYSHPEIVRQMVLQLRMYWAKISPRRRPRVDMEANPALRNFVWTPWLSNEEEVQKYENIKHEHLFPPFPLQVSVGELQYLTNLNLNLFKNSFTEYMKKTADAFVESIASLFSF
ncbi:arylsulfatase B-like [Anticarsia gemmatalis]|uniref:arylsulfatase B-like n=1 Tax=Anticarsia gemmatalis TaxID=129554 RepID=UPI003F759AC9